MESQGPAPVGPVTCDADLADLEEEWEDVPDRDTAGEGDTEPISCPIRGHRCRVTSFSPGWRSQAQGTQSTYPCPPPRLQLSFPHRRCHPPVHPRPPAMALHPQDSLSGSAQSFPLQLPRRTVTAVESSCQHPAPEQHSLSCLLIKFLSRYVLGEGCLSCVHVCARRGTAQLSPEVTSFCGFARLLQCIYTFM